MKLDIAVEDSSRSCAASATTTGCRSTRAPSPTTSFPGGQINGDHGHAASPKSIASAWTVLDYRGGKTTLCAGCGHNAISERIIDAFYEMGIAPERVVKMSGIGCSSKVQRISWAARTASTRVHGRMPSVATGAMLANRTI
jgi:hypothetical protein